MFTLIRYVGFAIIALFVVSCTNTEAVSEKDASNTTEEAQKNETALATKNSNSVIESKLIPATLFQDKLDGELSFAYMANSDTVATLNIQSGKKSTPSLTLMAQINRDAAQLQRMVTTWTYQPGIVEEFENAGEQAVIVLTEETATSYYTVVFRTKLFFCSIESKIKKGESTDSGILYNNEKLKDLARAWADHIKNIEQ